MERSHVNVWIKNPGESFCKREIENSLESFQEIVGGYIEIVQGSLYGDLLICNEDGKVKGLPYNCMINDHMIVGPVILIGSEADDFADVTLTEKDIKKICYV